MLDAYEQEGLREEAVFEAFVRPRSQQRPTLLIDTSDTERAAAKVVVQANRLRAEGLWSRRRAL